MYVGCGLEKPRGPCGIISKLLFSSFSRSRSQCSRGRTANRDQNRVRNTQIQAVASQRHLNPEIVSDQPNTLVPRGEVNAVLFCDRLKDFSILNLSPGTSYPEVQYSFHRQCDVRHRGRASCVFWVESE